MTINTAGSMLIAGMMALIPLVLTAEIYQWTDELGQTHFGDRPPPKSNPKKIEVKINSYESVDVIYSPDWFYHSTDNGSTAAQTVVMYSTAWCKYCKKARSYFEKNKIAFVEYDVETSAKGKQDYMRLGASGVPIILVGKQRMNGFSKKRFQAIYSYKK